MATVQSLATLIVTDYTASISQSTTKDCDRWRTLATVYHAVIARFSLLRALGAMDYAGDMAAIGPYSRADALAKLDGRTREAKIMRETRAELIAHVGGYPSATQRALIERAAFLTLHLAQLDAKHATTGWSEHDVRQYLAWSNGLTRLMRQLGMKGAAQRAPSLVDHLAQRQAASTP